MGTILSFILHAVLWLIVLFLFFSIITNFVLTRKAVDFLVTNLKKCYEYIRQHVCKKGNEVNDDSGAIHDGPEFFDSSSVWED